MRSLVAAVAALASTLSAGSALGSAMEVRYLLTGQFGIARDRRARS